MVYRGYLGIPVDTSMTFGRLFFDVLLLLFFLHFFPKHATSLAELGANMVPTWAKMEAKSIQIPSKNQKAEILKISTTMGRN